MRVSRADQAEQRRAADRFEPGAAKGAVQPRGSAYEVCPCSACPRFVGVGCRAGGDRRAANGPVTEHRPQLCSDAWRRDREAEAQARQAEELAEGPQHDGPAPDRAGDAEPWLQVDEGFI